MLEEYRVNSFDGTELHYSIETSEHGYSADSVDFLLCDGIGCDGFIWRYLRPVLREHGRIIHLHMRGHGKSGAPQDEWAVATRHLADDCRVVLDDCQSSKVVVLGHSMGVQVVLEFWHRHRERTAAIVLLCGSFENPVATFHDGPVLKVVVPLMQAATALAPRPIRAAWRTLVAGPLSFNIARITEVHQDLARAKDFHHYFDHMSRVDPKVFFRMLAEAGKHSARPYLGDINVPVLVISGIEDRFTPARLSAEMAARIPLAETLVVEEGTHTAPIEYPTLVNLRIERFINQRVK